MKFDRIAKILLLGAGLALIAACANEAGVQAVAAEPTKTAAPSVEAAKADDAKPTTCTNPRPQACTMDYTPVCATRDTGIRCVTTPCPSSEKKTYSNGCGACSDPKVSEYVQGACP
jgi:hypothetical protein